MILNREPHVGDIVTAHRDGRAPYTGRVEYVWEDEVGVRGPRGLCAFNLHDDRFTTPEASA